MRRLPIIWWGVWPDLKPGGPAVTPQPILALLGPTGSAKSDVALRVAEELGATILSVDSMQVYRGMDIGTAKPTVAERRRVPHVMIDLVDPEENYTVAEFRRAAHHHLEQLGNTPVMVVGGSGLHFRAVVDPMSFPPHDDTLRKRLEETPPAELAAELLLADPEAGERLDFRNSRRLIRAVEILRLTGATPSARATGQEAAALREYRAERPLVAVGIDPGPDLPARLGTRLEGMLEAGLLREVTELAPRLGRNAQAAVGYRQLLAVVRGELAYKLGVEAVRKATLSLARRQRTFFRRDPRIRWVPWSASVADLGRVVREALLS